MNNHIKFEINGKTLNCYCRLETNYIRGDLKKFFKIKWAYAKTSRHPLTCNPLKFEHTYFTSGMALWSQLQTCTWDDAILQVQMNHLSNEISSRSLLETNYLKRLNECLHIPFSLHLLFLIINHLFVFFWLCHPVSCCRLKFKFHLDNQLDASLCFGSRLIRLSILKIKWFLCPSTESNIRFLMIWWLKYIISKSYCI